MDGFDLIQTPTWEISLSSGWEEVQGPSSELYFESNDETKGLYIATWQIEETAQHTSKSVAHNFRRVEQASLTKMAGYSWQLLFDEITCHDDGEWVARSDAVAMEQSYRIASKIITRLPIVVRANFHDYQCEDLAESQAFFAPIIHSLRVRAHAV